MKITDHNGRVHDINDENTLVTTFRIRAWRYMNHVYHLCQAETCSAAYGLYVYFFNPYLVELFLKQRFDELRRWKPSETEHQAWENYRTNRPIDKTEMERFAREISELPDDEIWNELDL